MRTLPSLTVVMPVYNELVALPAAVEMVQQFLQAHIPDHEIVIVESGSTDGTSALCDSLASPTVRVIHEGGRYGFGSALRTGFAAASKDLVTMVTADLPFDLQAILDGVRAIERLDCILSYRASDPRSILRRAQSVVFNLLVRLMFGLKVRHVNSAFKLYRRDLIASLPLQANGWAIDTEIVYRLTERGATFREIPVPLIDRTVGTSSIGVTTPLRIARELVQLRRALRRSTP